MSIALLVISAFLVYGAFVTITQVGKPRKEITPTMAAVITLVDAAIVIVLVIAAMRLGGI